MGSAIFSTIRFNKLGAVLRCFLVRAFFGTLTDDRMLDVASSLDRDCPDRSFVRTESKASIRRTTNLEVTCSVTAFGAAGGYESYLNRPESPPKRWTIPVVGPRCANNDYVKLCCNSAMCAPFAATMLSQQSVGMGVVEDSVARLLRHAIEFFNLILFSAKPRFA